MKCANCSAELAPEHRFCEVCGAVRPPFAQRIAESEREFRILSAQHQSGQLDDAALSAELKKLVVHEEDSGYWMLGARTGRWYWFDGQQWVLRDPPLGATYPVDEAAVPPVSVQAAPVSSTPPVVAAAAPNVSPSASMVERPATQAPGGAQAGPARATLPSLQRMLFVGAAGTLGALLGVLLAYIVSFFCRAESPSGQLTCLFLQFAALGAGMGFALGLGCGLLLGADVRGAGLGIPLGAMGGLTGGILLMATQLTLLRAVQGAEAADPGLLAQSVPLLVYGLAMALMIGLLPGFLVRSPSRAVSGAVACGIAAAALFLLVLLVQGVGLASHSESIWTGYPLGMAGLSGRLAATAWPALLHGVLLGLALGHTSVPD